MPGYFCCRKQSYTASDISAVISPGGDINRQASDARNLRPLRKFQILLPSLSKQNNIFIAEKISQAVAYQDMVKILIGRQISYGSLIIP